MSLPTALALPLADLNNHMDWGGGWWVVMAFGMVLFWGLVIAGVVWLVRELSGPRHHAAATHAAGHTPGASDPLAVLDHRLADGTISPEEYRERRAVLAGKDPDTR